MYATVIKTDIVNKFDSYMKRRPVVKELQLATPTPPHTPLPLQLSYNRYIAKTKFSVSITGNSR